MITIITKDNATIIAIENPTASEERVIKVARDVEKLSSDSVWSKFKCNQKRNADRTNEQPVQEMSDFSIDLSDFEEIISENEIPL